MESDDVIISALILAHRNRSTYTLLNCFLRGKYLEHFGHGPAVLTECDLTSRTNESPFWRVTVVIGANMAAQHNHRSAEIVLVNLSSVGILTEMLRLCMYKYIW